MTKERKKLIEKLDKKWSLAIKQRDKICILCKKDWNLQSAHIFSRSHLGTRWNITNGLCLCGGCHIFFAHKNPIEFSELVRLRLGEERYQKLRQEAQMITKFSTVDLQLMYDNWDKINKE